jgi:hypothetical protein
MVSQVGGDFYGYWETGGDEWLSPGRMALVRIAGMIGCRQLEAQMCPTEP